MILISSSPSSAVLTERGMHEHRAAGHKCGIVPIQRRYASDGVCAVAARATPGHLLHDRGRIVRVGSYAKVGTDTSHATGTNTRNVCDHSCRCGTLPALGHAPCATTSRWSYDC